MARKKTLGQRVKCVLGFHEWTRPKKVDVMTALFYTELTYTKHCKNCTKFTIEKVRANE